MAGEEQILTYTLPITYPASHQWEEQILDVTASLPCPPVLIATGVANLGSYVEITFDDDIALTGPAALVSGWSISETTTYTDPVISAVSVTSGNKVRLDITNQTDAGSYTVNLPLVGINAVPGSAPLTGPFALIFSGLGSAPTISALRALDSRTLEVIFSEGVLEADAVIPGNYVITSPALAVTQSVKVTDWVYRLTTEKQTAGTSYTLTVSNIRDLFGNYI